MVKRRSARKGRLSRCGSGCEQNDQPLEPGKAIARFVLAAAMDSIQTRLHDLTGRCNAFQAKYGDSGQDMDRAPDSISVTLRWHSFVCLGTMAVLQP